MLICDTICNQELIQRMIDKLQNTFVVKDFERLNSFRGIKVMRTKRSYTSPNRSIFIISQKKGQLQEDKLVGQKRISKYDDQPLEDFIQYKSMVDALKYYTLTMPNIVY